MQLQRPQRIPSLPIFVDFLLAKESLKSTASGVLLFPNSSSINAQKYFCRISKNYKTNLNYASALLEARLLVFSHLKLKKDVIYTHVI